MSEKTNLKLTRSKRIKFVTKSSPIFPNKYDYIKKHISILHSDDALKNLSPIDFFCTIYKRHKHLKYLIAPSSYPIKSKH